MLTNDFNVTQGIHGFQAVKAAYSEKPEGGRETHARLPRPVFRCPGCGQGDVANANRRFFIRFFSESVPRPGAGLEGYGHSHAFLQFDALAEIHQVV